MPAQQGCPGVDMPAEIMPLRTASDKKLRRRFFCEVFKGD
jgi:hypothetical protein